MESGDNKSIKGRVYKTVILLADSVLLLFLSWELWQVVQRYQSIQDALNGNILSDDINHFVAQLQSQLPPAWLWFAIVIGIIGTLGFLLGVIFIPKKYFKKTIYLNLAWIIIWGAIVIGVVVQLIMTLKQLTSLFA